MSEFETLSDSFSIGLDPITIISFCAFAAIVLVLAVLAVVALFGQKRLLKQIQNTLMRQGGAPAPLSFAAPAPNTCKKCGSAHSPGSVFCQNCGSAL